MDLHAWITQQVERVEAAARKAADCTTAHRWEAIGSLIVAVPDVNTAGPEIIEVVLHTYDEALVHVAANDPAAILRRCEADRRILARHRIDPGQAAFPGACEGCGLDNWDLPNTESVNYCPELLDLAHAHGITPAIIAGLDQPQPPEPKPSTGSRLVPADILAPRTPMRDVPAALRGPNWKP
ncbi:DUF6221 family protein [Streptomyces sp. NPDC085946]|uniref:DUF6221 family protein n=1 Tax=Streptomyces sp. NPDC085946 TaxID=3365744 RepID=UPI0037D86BC6